MSSLSQEVKKEGEVDAVDFFTAVWEDGALEEVVVEPKKIKSQG